MPNRAYQKACQNCQGRDCGNCLSSPKKSTPVRLYTPKGAIRALLVGKTLKDNYGHTVIWNSSRSGFLCKDKKGQEVSSFDFSGLFEDL
jgi:hypothetical protein